MVGAMPMVPLPRRSLDSSDRVRRWYENELGWATAPGTPVRLRVGLRFDVLDVPAEAGCAALRHLDPGSPVAVRGDRMRLLVAAGSAEELPGLLDWLEWGTLPLDLTAIGPGGVMDAPRPPGSGAALADPCSDPLLDPLEPGEPETGPSGPAGGRPLSPGRSGGSLQGAAVWLRPPEPGCEVEASLPTLSAMGGGGGAPDLVRLVDTVATHCHRIRLRRACAQPFAFS
ncbi:SCO3374 family protein [Streptomyces sp. KR55]|uniref:SCO3374 family protein n=1 Tax=Streptomyces sp. KR55 TaxID=3457425 RepID=UPI003FD566F6